MTIGKLKATTVAKTSLITEVNSRCFKIHRSSIPCSSCQMLVNFSGVVFQRTVFKFKNENRGLLFTSSIKVMLQETIHNDDFLRNTALQHCCGVVWNGCNIVPTLKRCVALKIVVANRLV